MEKDSVWDKRNSIAKCYEKWLEKHPMGDKKKWKEPNSRDGKHIDTYR